MASELLKKAARVDTDPMQKRLVKDYTNLCSQVMTNKAAMKDSLTYVKGLNACEDVEIAANATQMKELAIRIDSGKRRREAALAAMIAQEWKGQKCELKYLVRQVEPTESLQALHEKFTETLNSLSQNGAEVVALRAKVKSCLQNAQSVGDTVFQELEIASNGLTMALSERSTLENLRRQLCMELARSSDAIFQLAMQLIEEAPLWLH
ncbi:hypothetical protein V7S43_005071 [Phytophthora oleae]|uniref:Uncharacterized protein n=1 Tax=Phytophthora oleae TaxID=2107226 RepID=A0ABD3FRY2_9STRA